MEILPGIHRIANAVSTAYLLTNDANGLTLVDTGPAHFDRTILRYLTQIGHQPSDVQRIILTHRHFDHMGSAAALKQATGATVWAHPIDIPQIDGTEKNRMPKGAAGAVMSAVVPLVFPIRPCAVDKQLADGQAIDLGSLGDLQVVFTPGHTLGHCSLLLSSRRLLILGDALNNFSGVPQIPFDAVNDDTNLTRKTAIDLATRALPADALVFGHGNPILNNGQAALQKAATKAKAGN